MSKAIDVLTLLENVKPSGKIKYITIDTRTIEGLKKAEALKEKGWIVGSVGLNTIQMYKKQ